ncbi:MAG: hypothetical protein LBD37_09445 [Treponema sp.]|jgi:galactokinase|nr:hypothetical protein [Treponema sp.]
MLDTGQIHRAEYDAGEDRSEPMVIAEAPGRMHYLGEHGEPKAGLFLASAIDRFIRIAVSPRKDNSLRFFAADLGERKRTTLINLKYKREDRWANFIKVAIHVLVELGCPVKGLNFSLTGDIPPQAGFASSSAIEVAAAAALREFFHADIADRELLKHLAASHALFFGKSANIVDYEMIFFAEAGHFLIVDEASMEIKQIESPFARYKILIMDSRVPRLGVEDELRQRRLAIKKGLELLSLRKEGINFRNFAAGDLVEYIGDLPEEIRRRSMHIIQELRRVNDAEEALKKPDFAVLSKVFFHSHESLRDLYEVSCPEIDWLVKRAQETEGVLGSRMTGQGFGGCTYTIIAIDAVEEYRRRLEDYERIFGFRPLTYEVRLAGGARILSPLQLDSAAGSVPAADGGTGCLESSAADGGTSGLEPSAADSGASGLEPGAVNGGKGCLEPSAADGGISGLEPSAADGGASGLEPSAADSGVSGPEPSAADGGTSGLEPGAADSGAGGSEPNAADGGASGLEPDAVNGGTGGLEPSAADGGISGLEPGMADDGVSGPEPSAADGGTDGSEPEAADGGASGLEPGAADGGASGLEPSVAASGASGLEPGVADSGTGGLEPSAADGGASGLEPSAADSGVSGLEPSAADSGAGGLEPDAADGGTGCLEPSAADSGASGIESSGADGEVSGPEPDAAERGEGDTAGGNVAGR